ncbi:hypothetical protein [Paenibacillus roseipurpureus]|uniref:Uncharacterized protein n=1 Tax=Paenibacillus roseopurpureus TaxID=2918901 RepID=A0AA96LMR6_9BACL|nr:hypothetical protein [Paenibacillus sp. MBLB1832]WNR43859.1 hypothetical protein MJB10_22600 [Paenibacillus sp. MBLB1832]
MIRLREGGRFAFYAKTVPLEVRIDGVKREVIALNQGYMRSIAAIGCKGLWWRSCWGAELNSKLI